MRGRRRLQALAVTALVAAVLTGCGGDDDGGTASPADDGDGDGGANVMQVEEIEYAYELSGTLREGWATLDVSNTGDEYHMMGIGLLQEGVTVEDVRDTLLGGPEGPGGGGEEGDDGGDADDEGALGAVQLVSAQTDDEGGEDGEGGGEDPFEALFEGELGAPGHILAPGQSAAITAELEAGEYAIICFLPTPGGESVHAAEGMLGTITVEESDDRVTETPDADVSVSIEDGSIEGLDELASGETIDVTMTGEHEFGFVRVVEEGATYDELDEHFSQFDEGALPLRDQLEDGPGVFEFLAFSVEGGQRFFIRRDLEPGTYLVGCTLDESDEGDPDGRDHGRTEMKEITVS